MDAKLLLKELNLSNKEAQVFLVTLELGIATAYEIAKKAKVKRTTTYSVLEQLMEKKFVFEIKKKKKKVYTTLQPTQLLKLWEEKQARIKKEMTILSDLMPELQSLYNKSPRKPIIRYYEGREGVQDVHYELLKNPDTNIHLYYFTAVDYVEEIVGKEWFMEYIRYRIRRKIPTVGIRNKAKEIPNPLYIGKKEYLRDYRFAPVWVQIPMALYIRGNYVGVVSSKEESYAFLIESREYATLMKSLFDVLWSISEEIL